MTISVGMYVSIRLRRWTKIETRMALFSRSWKREDFGHDIKRKCAHVGQHACPCWATCLPHLGKVRAQKWDKTRLETTVSGEERQMPEAGTQRQY